MNTREVGGVVVLGIGLVLLIGAIRGTWGNVWHTLFAGGQDAAGKAGGAGRGAGGLRPNNNPAAGGGGILDPVPMGNASQFAAGPGTAGDSSLFGGAPGQGGTIGRALDPNSPIGAGYNQTFGTLGISHTLWGGPQPQGGLVQA